MANDERPITVFDTYYYAADRWGGWPLLLAKLLHRDTGLQWTDQRLHYVRTTWLFFGLLVLAALNPSRSTSRNRKRAHRPLSRAGIKETTI